MILQPVSRARRRLDRGKSLDMAAAVNSPIAAAAASDAGRTAASRFIAGTPPPMGSMVAIAPPITDAMAYHWYSANLGLGGGSRHGGACATGLPRISQ